MRRWSRERAMRSYRSTYGVCATVFNTKYKYIVKYIVIEIVSQLFLTQKYI
jgi:hypothetical protein